LCIHTDTTIFAAAYVLALRYCATMPTVRLHHFQGDIIAGITVGLTVVPQSLAYANIAELPPQVCSIPQSLSSTSTFSGRLNVTLFHLLPYIIDLKFFFAFLCTVTNNEVGLRWILSAERFCFCFIFVIFTRATLCYPG